MPNRHPFAAVLVGLLGLTLALTGCASARPQRDDPGNASYTLVTLVSGPNSGSGTKDERQAMFRGHMANINRLVETGELLMAGPFGNPTDPTWRGLFVLDISDPAMAGALVATDPGVISGEFAARVRPMQASSTLRQSLALYRALEAEQAASASDATAPPTLMRAYVILTAADVERAARAVRESRFTIVWQGRFTDGDGNGGVIVVDATEPASVRNALPAAASGPCVIDGWFSTASHVRLPEAARR